MHELNSHESSYKKGGVEVENDPMQPDHEADDLQALLRDEYGAPRLDVRFSADLIARLQAEASPSFGFRTWSR